jgi:chemotaxis protein methyltransferase CheR
MNSEILPFFAKFLEQELGTAYPEQSYRRLEYRLGEIADALNMGGLEKLYQEAQKGIHGHFRQLLLDQTVDNPTFFRDPQIFQAIRSLVLPSLARSNSPNEKLAIWSAASSTGQEALSLTMMMHEWQLQNSTVLPFSVTATDISESAIKRARSGCFTQLEMQRGLSASQIVKYFQKDTDEHWKAKFELQHFINYRHMSWRQPLGFGCSFDLILCRNVLLCQNPAGKAEVVRKISQNLKPGGFLILGPGETLEDHGAGYMPMKGHGALLYRKL